MTFATITSCGFNDDDKIRLTFASPINNRTVDGNKVVFS